MKHLFLFFLIGTCLMSCGNEDEMPTNDEPKVFDQTIEKFDLTTLDDKPIIKKVVSSTLGVTYALIENQDTEVNQIIEFKNNEWISFNFEFCDACIEDIDIHENGDLWVAAPGYFPYDQPGVGIYRFTNNFWQTLSTEGGYTDLIVVEENEVWLKHYNLGLAYFSEGDIQFQNGPNTPVTNVASGFTLDKNKTLWMKFPSSLGYHDGMSYGNPADPDFPEQIAVDGMNRVWIGLGWGELGYFEEMVWKPNTISDFDGEVFFRDVNADDKNSVWIAADKLVRMQDNGSRTDFDKAQLTGGEWIDKIYVDRQDRKWVSSDGLPTLVMINDF